MKLFLLVQVLAFFGGTIEGLPNERNLQMQNFDLSFGFGGVNIEPEDALARCPVQYSNIIYCMVEECENFALNCPSLKQEATDVPVSCSGVKNGVCSQTIEESCCLKGCNDAFLTLTTCMGELDGCTGPIDCSVALLENGQKFVTEAPVPDEGATAVVTEALQPVAGNVTEAPDPVPGNITTSNVTTANATTDTTSSSTSESEKLREPLISMSKPENPATVVGLDVGSVLQLGSYGGNDVRQACPDEWMQWVTCVVSKCENFVDVCPSVKGEAYMTPMSGNGYLDSTCDDLGDDVCAVVGGCCLEGCVVETQRITTCLHNAKEALDLTYCPVVDCSIDPDGGTSTKSGTYNEKKEEPKGDSTSGENFVDFDGEEDIVPYRSGASSKSFSLLFLGSVTALMA